MFKVTPNPPDASNAAPADTRFQAAAQRAIHHYLPQPDAATASGSQAAIYFPSAPTSTPRPS